MAFDYSSAEIHPGRTVPLPLPMLEGCPVAHVEYLGDTNATWVAEMVAAANAPTKKGPARQTKKTAEQERLENLALCRERLAKHIVRRLEAKHSDTGLDATTADIPAWVESIPQDVAYYMFNYARNSDHFREYAIQSDPKAIAEK